MLLIGDLTKYKGSHFLIQDFKIVILIHQKVH